NSDTATPAVIDAVDDDYTATPLNGFDGGTLGSVLDNDRLNGSPVTIDGSDTIISIVADGGLTGVTLDDDGTITVPAGTPAGSYTLTYQICSEASPGMCDTATAIVQVDAATIVVLPDAVSDVDGQAGADDVLTVFTNDSLNGVDLTDLSDTAISVVTPATPIGGNPVPVLDVTDGTVDVPAGTPQGVYVITYEICEILNPTNCATTTATVTVQAEAPVAVDDSESGLTVGSAASIDVIGNDTDVDGSIDPTTVSFTDSAAIDTNGDGYADTLTVPDEGVWSADPVTGEVTFTPEPDFTSDPTPVGYTVADNDGNVSNEATITLDYDQLAGLTLVKAAIDVVDTNANEIRGDAGDTVTYRFTVTNTGNVRLSPVTLDDPVIGVAGLVIAGTLDPGAAASVEVDYVFTAGDETRGYVENSAIADATGVDEGGVPYPGPGGASLSASVVSDAGSDPVLNPVIDPLTTETPDGTGATDGNPANDPTVTRVPLEPSSLALSGTVFLDGNGDGLYSPGETTLPGYEVRLVDSAGDVIDTVFTDADGAYSFEGFPTGTYSLLFLEPDDGNPATPSRAVGQITDLVFVAGTVMTDVNQPVDPSGVIYNSATGAPIAGVTLRVTDTAGTPLPDACLLPGQQPQVTTANGQYRFDILPGAAAACPVGETEYLIELFSVPSGFILGESTVYPAQSGALDATSCAIDAVPGGACNVSSSSSAPPAGTSVPYYLAFLLAAGDPDVVGNHIPVDPELVPADESDVTIEKSTPVDTVLIGQTVPYTITVTNNTLFGIGPLVVRDTLPVGMLFTPGSATLRGVAVTPDQSGQSLTFDAITLAPEETVTIMLSARVASTAEPGDLVNRADALDAVSGAALAPTATATVRLAPEHVFDCSDVIGKVFDDRDRDGYQDGPIVLRGGKVYDDHGRQITDRSILTALLAGRDTSRDQVLREGEPGMPHVRVVTTRGVIITTDEHGRFHVPCAELPKDIGSNFTMKLDTRSLPTGYRVTTENPRTVRLTAGKMAKLNFGVSIGKVVDIDLMDAAFASGSSEPKAALKQAIGPFVAKFANTPAVLRISYFKQGEDSALIRERLDVVERLMREEWKRVGRGKLIVERTIKYVQ
ncbi:MAG: DUF11 domain-containing protein, partial [Rhodobacteraceae bacterium]|nr:DUF11 domain-containing protein [Paracoccaceae bacterium]